MKASGCVRAVFLLVALGMFLGCDAEKQAPATAPAADKSAATTASPASGAPGAPPPASPQDQSDAREAAARVMEQLKGGEFAAIYQQAAPPFRELGSEQQFVAMMQQTRQKTGTLQGFQQTGQETGADKRQMVNYSVDYDNVKSKLRLSFLRSQGGKLELVGLNQKDDVVKKQKKPVAAK